MGISQHLFQSQLNSQVQIEDQLTKL